jgi:hypothetical protein
MRPGLTFLVLLMLFPEASRACSVGVRPAGTPVSVPTELIEVHVVEERKIHDLEFRAGRYTDGQEIVVEVLRSLIGSRPTGERITIRHGTEPSMCQRSYALNSRLLLASFPDGPPLSVFEEAYQGETFTFGFGAIADVPGPWRTSRKKSLARVLLRGDVSDFLGERLLRLSSLDARDGCGIVVGQKFAHVACGVVTDGSASANEVVMFEKVDDRWTEVARYGPGIARTATSAP